MITHTLHRLAAAGLLAAVVGVGGLAPSAVAAASSPPATDTYFICPSTSTHNAHGMWVTGAHGAYYVLIPTKGGANAGSRVYLTIPVQVTSTAQIPAGWALYKDVASYPNFEGMTVLLSEGIANWLDSPAGWQELDMAMVSANGDGTYTISNLTRGASIVIDHPIPLASAAVW